MINAKKALAVALAGSMALTSFTGLSFASELTTSKKLEVLKDLDVIKGDNTDNSSLDLTKNMERYRSVVLLLRLAEGNKEGDLNSYNPAGQPSFADAGSFSSYVEKLMAFTHNTDVGIDGYDDGTFKPLDVTTDRAYAKMMLEALGYNYGTDFTWSGTEALAEQVGLATKGSIENSTATVGEIVELTYNALATPVKGSDITLGEKIGKAVVETKFEVKAVESDNLKSITVKFSRPVDEESATDLANYKLSASTASLTGATIKLADDKTAVITLGTAGTQQESIKLTVDGVKSADSKVLPKTVKSLSLLDQTVPTVASVKAAGIKTIRVEFSEPMKEVLKDNFLIKDGSKKLYINTVTPVGSDLTTFDVKLYNDLKDGEISVEVSNTKDFANFGTVRTTKTVPVSIDSEAPVVESVKEASPNKVVLVFNEDIASVKNTLDADDFYHTNSNNKADTVAIDGNELTVTFADANKLPTGTAYLFIDEDVLVDLWGNKAEDTIRVQLNVVEDTEAPQLKETKVVAEDKLTITFTEDLDQASAENKSNYSLMNSKDEEKKLIKSVKYSDKVVTITFTEKLSGDYSIVMKDIKDKFNNKFAGTIEFKVTDLTAPVYSDFVAHLYNVSNDEQIIRINFKEAMALEGKYSVVSEDNYIVAGQELSDIENAYITESEEGKFVELHIPTASLALQINDTVQIARVADASGNYTAQLSGSVVLSSAALVTIVGEDVMAVSKNTVVINFSDELTEIDTDDFVIIKDVAGVETELAVSSVSVANNSQNDGNTMITFTLADELNGKALTTDGGTVKVKIKTANSHNVYGVPVELNAMVTVVDRIAPEADKDASSIADNKTLNVKFSETLAGSVALIATDLDVTLDGKALVAGNDYTVELNGDVLTVKLAGDKVIENDITVSLKDNAHYLQDTAGNIAKTFDFNFEN